MSKLMEIGDLRGFAAAARSGSMTRGAAALGTSQPALSQRIQRLEKAAGHQLLRRQRTGTQPTPAGERLLAYAERILALHDEAAQALVAPDGPQAGRRTVAILEDLAVDALPAVLADFAALYPQIDLDVKVAPFASVRRLAERGRIDVLVGSDLIATGMERSWRHRTRLAWACSPAFDPGREPLPLVMFALPCLWREGILDCLSQHGRDWRVAFESNSLAAVQAAVAAGVGLAALLPPNIGGGITAVSRREDLPSAPATELAIARRTGTRNDQVLNRLERLLLRALEGTYEGLAEHT